MKVLQILPELNAGGVERGTLEVAKYLCNNGHESLVLSNGGQMVEQLEEDGSRHITLPVHRKRLVSLLQINKIRKVLLEEKVDIVHLRSRLPAWLTWIAIMSIDPSKRPKVISTFHGFYSTNKYSSIMTKGTKVICISKSIKQHIIRHYPKTNKSKLVTIYRGISPNEFPFNFKPHKDWVLNWYKENSQLQNRYVILLPGRITRWKGQLDFLKIILLLKNNNIPVHGLVVGNAHPKRLNFLEELRFFIEHNNLQDQITIIEHRNDLREIMSVSDVVLSCSTDPEAFGRVTLEALSLGKPVAGYSHGGVEEQLNELFPEGKVPPGDYRRIYQLLTDWFKSKPSPHINDKFSKEIMLKLTIKTYNLALNNM